MSAATDHRKTRAVLAAGAALSAVGWTYRGALAWIVEGWRENPYYTHGPLVPLIVAGLLWRSRALLRTTPWVVWWPGLAVVALAAVMFVAGYALDVNVAVALSLWVLLHGAVLTCAGRRLHRAALFPLVFLIFAVPIPQLLIYDVSFPLQLVSANLAPLLIRLLTGARASATGEVMWLDGQEYVVGVQCSGFKALVGLVMLGLLVAHLTDTDRWRKVVIALLTPVLAVAANVVRLFLILGVGRMWGHDFAVGTFHDISGGIMVLVAIGLLLGAARLVVGPGADLAGAPAPAARDEAPATPDWPPLVATAALVALTGLAGTLLAPPTPPAPSVDLAAIPRTLGPWVGSDFPPDPRVQAELGNVALVHRAYVRPGADASVQMIVICGRGRRSLHTPQACYRGAGNEILGKDDITLEVAGDRLNLRRLVVGKDGRPVLLAIYTFSDGKSTTPEWRRQQRESFRHSEVVWTQIHFAASWEGTVSATQEVLDPFMALAWPAIRKAIPRG